MKKNFFEIFVGLFAFHYAVINSLDSVINWEMYWRQLLTLEVPELCFLWDNIDINFYY